MPSSNCWVVLLLLILCACELKGESSCCWCGKRYTALPGYWEGSSPDSVGDRFELVFLPSQNNIGSIALIRPSNRDCDSTRILVEQGEHLLLNKSITCGDNTLQLEILLFELHPVIEEEEEEVITASVIGLNDILIISNEVRVKETTSTVRKPLNLRSSNDNESFPFGWFVNYGGWLASPDHQDSATLSDQLLGTVLCPVSPYEPGGWDKVEEIMTNSPPNSWLIDLQHMRNLDEIRDVILRFKESGALRGWYLADEPDGAGNIPGAPIGFRHPLEVLKLYNFVRFIDENHPVVLSLNCLQSAPL